LSVEAEPLEIENWYIFPLDKMAHEDNLPDVTLVKSPPIRTGDKMDDRYELTDGWYEIIQFALNLIESTPRASVE
jgi:hypothetical protein